jgi:uncharacterized protein (DUF433 family)
MGYGDGRLFASTTLGQKHTGTDQRKMDRVRWQDHVVIGPDLHHGDPCIRGTRIPVSMIVGSLADGMGPDEIRDAYPQLTDEDIQAALAYAADVIYQDAWAPLPALESEYAHQG